MHCPPRAPWRATSRPAVAVVLLAGAVLLTAGTPRRAYAQSQATTGVIRGVVDDSTGAPVAGAVATLHNIETNFERTLSTNDRGVFVATLLPLGTYDVTVRALGYGLFASGGVVVRVGQTIEFPVVLRHVATALAEVRVAAQTPTVEATRVEAATRLNTETVSGLPNNGRNFLNLTLLTPNVAITQGPDGDELSIAGQRGIHNNVAVDGADFNNPFFGEQRGGQRPAFTFNLDAVQEVVVVSQGANAEFGRSSGGFVNVITKSGTNELRGTAHYYGKSDAFSAVARHDLLSNSPDFRQNQFGFTLGGPIVKNSAFFFIAYDQQLYTETKQRSRPRSAQLDSLRAFTDTAYGGVLRGDFGAIARTNDANALLVKTDFRLSPTENLTLKYNWTNSQQENGTFDVDTWARSANAVERDWSHAVNGSLTSQLSSSLANELRFQVSREDRPRPYAGPQIPGRNRPFPDTGMDFANGFRLGMPFFIPVKSYDTRIQLLDNISLVRGDHLVKAGAEWNRTEENQTFIGFANGRFIFNSVTGFENYVSKGSGYVECKDGTTRTDGQCPGAGNAIVGPVLLYLQQTGVNGRTVEEAGTQRIPQHELAAYVQDTWNPRSNLTLNYGLRWEAQIEPAPITPPDQVFFAPLIGKTVVNPGGGTFSFPSNGRIPSDWAMWQPRLGAAWDVGGDGREVVRASAGLYYARVPGLNLASARSTNGSIGQTLFRNSALIPFLGRPPAYDSLLPSPAGTPFQPSVFVFDRNFKNPRTVSATLGYEREIANDVAASLSFTVAATDHLTRFVDRNDAVFGRPWSAGIGSGGANGVGTLTTVESSAYSHYQGLTVGLKRSLDPRLQFQLNYTLSYDKSDDDNERDPFSFRYARADSLGREYGYSDRDQRHRFNAFVIERLPFDIVLNNRVSAYSAQPASEKCGVGNVGTGQRAVNPGDRICPDGHILARNTLRRDDAYFSWDVRVSRPFDVGPRNRLEAIVEVFNLTNHDNFRDPAATSLLFNFDGTIRSGLGDPRQLQAGLRLLF